MNNNYLQFLKEKLKNLELEVQNIKNEVEIVEKTERKNYLEAQLQKYEECLSEIKDKKEQWREAHAFECFIFEIKEQLKNINKKG
jgi:hypothetical protein